MSRAGSVLCIDAGNTLVKWCLHENLDAPFVQPSAFFSHATVEFKPFSESFSALHLQLTPCLPPMHSVAAVLLSNVLGADFEQALRAVCAVAGVPLHVLTVNRHAEVQSAYENPTTLGKDRWAGCLALTEVSKANVNLLVSFGTATTLDVMVKNSQWQHMGGFIVPGLETMLRSLHADTAELPKVQIESLGANTWPTSTEQAIAWGVGRMQQAMVDSVATQLTSEHGEPAAIWLTGGFAPAMQVHWPQAKLLEHAVFKGLFLDYRLAGKGAMA